MAQTSSDKSELREAAQAPNSKHQPQQLRDTEIAAMMEEASELRAAGRFSEAAAIWKQLLQYAELNFGPDHPNTSGSLNKLAHLYYSQGLFRQAVPLLKRALATSEKTLGSDHPDTATSLNNLAFIYSKQGLYIQAKSLYKQALAIYEKALGPDHFDTATGLNNLAGVYVAQGFYGQAKPLYLRSLAIREKTLGSDHLDTATSLNNLAALYSDQGLYSQAEPLYRRALAIMDKALGPDHPDTATSFNNLALLYSKQGLHSQAEPLSRRALAIREKALGPDHPDTAASLNNLASLYSDQGLYSQAEPLYRRVLAIREKALGVDHLYTAASLNNLALLYGKQGLYSQAEPLLKRALAINEKSLGSDHPTTGTTINNLAQLYNAQRLSRQAEPLFKRALAITEQALGPDHPDTATRLRNLAGLYRGQGHYHQSEPLLKRALAITEQALGPDHPGTATSLNNLASLYSDQGLYSQAGPLYMRALAIREKALGADHPDTAASLNNLALLYREQGLYSQAERLYKRALAIREKALGADHPDIAQSITNLALLYDTQGYHGKAEPLVKRALAIYEKAFGPDHPDTSLGLNNLAWVYASQGLYTKAEPLYLRSLTIREKVLGPDHPNTSQSLSNLAVLYFNQGLFGQGLQMLSRGLSIEQYWLTREAINQSSSQRLALGARLGWAWQAPFSWINLDSYASELAFATRLQRHGLLLEIQKSQTLISRFPGEHQELAAIVTDLNRQLSDVQLMPARRASLRERRDDLEKQLYRQLPSIEIPRLSTDQVAAALPADGALVEFQRFRPFDPKASADKRWGPPRYLALILKPTGAITAVRLGPAEPIEQAIAKALSASAQNTSDAAERWGEVSKLVIAPLEPHLAGSRQWFLSPDAELHRVPFAALPSSTTAGEFLGSSVELRLITTGRDLVRFQTPAPDGQTPVVIANPNYERGTKAPATLVASASPQQRSGELSAKAWQPLPATAEEGDEIATLLGTAPITRDEATVSVLERTIGPRVLHIASHGFFLGDQDLPPQDPLRDAFSATEPLQGFQGEDPLLRSGLVLAGANNPGLDPNDDGLLTALEATALQLDGTELVVLSACSTAQGDLRVGEGVYGLQRAFTVAGARSTLLSLWKVDDKATQAFMVSFYKRLKEGAGRADALAATQAEFRNHPIEDWRDPYYWAAWQLTGDWRPIAGL